MKTSKSIFAICVVALILTSCEKGDTGPQGAPGLQGQAGNANVHTANYTISSLSTGSNYKYKNLYPSMITSDIINNGAVMAYLYTSSGWAAMPYTILVNSSVQQFYRGYVSTGKYYLKINNSDSSTPSVSVPFSFKIVTIDGLARASHPDVNLNNYEEVKEAFNLID